MNDSSLSLFGDIVTQAPATQGIKYAGSKQKLLPYILSMAGKIKPRTVLDAFSGSTRVSQAFAYSGYSVTANDVSVWSEVLASCYLLNDKPKAHYQSLIDHLNNLPPEEGWFTQHYGGDPAIDNTGCKRPWQKHNTQKLDAIRAEIDRLNVKDVEKKVLLCSLIQALDSVDSTLGHYASYLSDWSPRSYKTMRLCVPELTTFDRQHKVYKRDIFELLPDVQVDLAYFDPPYGSNNEKMPPSRVRYAAYYHIWTTICLNDKPSLFGKVNRRCDTSDTLAASDFEEFRCDSSGKLIAVASIERAVREVNAKYVLLSYSSGGRATALQLNDVLSSNGKLIDVMEIDHKKNVMANMRWTNEWVKEAEAPHREFLFLLEKT